MVVFSLYIEFYGDCFKNNKFLFFFRFIFDLFFGFFLYWILGNIVVFCFNVEERYI